MMVTSASPSGKASAAVSRLRLAEVTGPVVGGRWGRPFSASLDAEDIGYVEEEYHLAGEAAAYRPVGALEPDGYWAVEAGKGIAYTTRILVRRPRAPRRFNGVVVCEWANVTLGYELIVGEPAFFPELGAAYVSISAQPVGVHGFSDQSIALKPWDPERYAHLTIPGDSFCYDIFSQAARAVGPKRGGAVDPMGGLDVREVVALGVSQSAGRLLSYLNAVQPLERVFDAAAIVIGFGRGTGFGEEGQVRLPEPGTLTAVSPPAPAPSYPTRLRDDLSIPVMMLNTETEALACFAVRQPDTAKFRYWEIAGASHGSAAWAFEYRQALMKARDGIPHVEAPRNTLDWMPNLEAALHHLVAWMRGGAPPPEQPRIEISGSPPKITRDAHGNARGGVRLPELEAPIASYHPGDYTKLQLGGATSPLSADQLHRLYPRHRDYVDRVRQAAEAAQRAGVIRARRVDQYVARAARALIPPPSEDGDQRTAADTTERR
jgi:hypothetical protein